MRSRVNSVTGMLLSARQCRLATTMCCLLVLVASFDSQFLMAVSLQNQAAISDDLAPTQEDSDSDEMLDVSASIPSFRPARKDAGPHKLACHRRGSALSSLQHFQGIVCHVHAERLGVGLPLRC